MQPGGFRARLKNFRKLGIPETNPGKGARVEYSPSDLFQLMVALELSEFGLDPALIVAIVRRNWTRQDGFFAAIQRVQLQPGRDVVAVVRPRVMSAALGKRRMVQTATEISQRSAPIQSRSNSCGPTARTSSRYLREPGERLSLFNLSARVREVSKAIKARQ